MKNRNLYHTIPFTLVLNYINSSGTAIYEDGICHCVARVKTHERQEVTYISHVHPLKIEQNSRRRRSR